MNVVPRVAVVGGVLAALSGCIATGSDPVQVGKDTYQIKVTGVGFTTQGGANQKALTEASEFCQRGNLHMVPTTSVEAGVYGWSPRRESLVFLCVKENDPRFINPPAMKTEQY